MATLTTVDRFGRVGIPKETRDHFGLAPGTPVTLEDVEEGILLKLAAPGAPLILKGGVLVFSGKAAGSADTHLRRIREARIRRSFPRRTR